MPRGDNSAVVFVVESRRTEIDQPNIGTPYTSQL